MEGCARHQLRRLAQWMCRCALHLLVASGHLTVSAGGSPDVTEIRPDGKRLNDTPSARIGSRMRRFCSDGIPRARSQEQQVYCTCGRGARADVAGVLAGARDRRGRDVAAETPVRVQMRQGAADGPAVAWCTRLAAACRSRARARHGWAGNTVGPTAAANAGPRAHVLSGVATRCGSAASQAAAPCCCDEMFEEHR